MKYSTGVSILTQISSVGVCRVQCVWRAKSSGNRIERRWCHTKGASTCVTSIMPRFRFRCVMPRVSYRNCRTQVSHTHTQCETKALECLQTLSCQGCHFQEFLQGCDTDGALLQVVNPEVSCQEGFTTVFKIVAPRRFYRPFHKCR